MSERVSKAGAGHAGDALLLGTGQLDLPFILGRNGGDGADVMTNSLVNNVRT